jgi:hypothetical protein
MAAPRPEGATTMVSDRRGPIFDSLEIVSSAFCICATGSLSSFKWLSSVERPSGSVADPTPLPVTTAAKMA